MVQRAAKHGTHEDVRNLSFPLLTPQQVEDRSNGWKQKQQITRLRVFNLLRKVTNLHRHVALQKRILIFLADNEVSGVRRVLSQSLRDGLSAKAMLHRLEQAFEGKYRAGGYSDKEFDLAILAMRLGGQAMLVALHQGAEFPGATSVYEKIRERSVSDSTAKKARISRFRRTPYVCCVFSLCFCRALHTTLGHNSDSWLFSPTLILQYNKTDEVCVVRFRGRSVHPASPSIKPRAHFAAV